MRIPSESLRLRGSRHPEETRPGERLAAPGGWALLRERVCVPGPNTGAVARFCQRSRPQSSAYGGWPSRHGWVAKRQDVSHSASGRIRRVVAECEASCACGTQPCRLGHPRPVTQSHPLLGDVFHTRPGGWGDVEGTSACPQSEHWGRDTVRSTSTAPEFRTGDQSSVSDRPSHPCLGTSFTRVPTNCGRPALPSE